MTDTIRDSQGRYAYTAESAETDARIIELRAKRWTFQEIADELRMDKAQVFRCAQRALKAIVAPAVDELRTIENEKYDLLERKAWEVMESRHYVVINQGPKAGELVKAPGSEDEYLVDGDVTLRSIQSILRISIERRKLNGMDKLTIAPKAALELTEEQLDIAIAAKLEELKERKNGLHAVAS